MHLFSQESICYNKTYVQIPIHSIMMNVSMWKYIFDVGKKELRGDDMLEILRTEFGYNQEPVIHGNRLWSMDQSYAACRIRNAKDVRVKFGDAILDRNRGKIGSKYDYYVDVHVSGFQKSRDMAWLQSFTKEMNLINENVLETLIKTLTATYTRS